MRMAGMKERSVYRQIHVGGFRAEFERQHLSCCSSDDERFCVRAKRQFLDG